MPSWHLMVSAGYHKIPVAVDNTNSGIAIHYNTITLQHCHLSAVVGILSPFQFLINCWFYHVLGCKNVKICRNNQLKWQHPCMHIHTPYHRHPCSLYSLSASNAASTHRRFSSSSHCFLSGSCFSSSSATCNSASSCSRSSLSHASHTLLISSACLHISVGNGWCVDSIV